MTHTSWLARTGFVICVATILWLALSPAPPFDGLSFDKANHVSAFLVLSVLADLSFPERRSFWPAACLLIGFGGLIEALQYWVGYRYFEVADLAANAIGITIYFLTRASLRARIDPVLKNIVG